MHVYTFSTHVHCTCISSVFLVDWKQLWQCGVLSLCNLFPEGKGARVKYSVVVEEDLSYTVSFQETAVNLWKCAVMSILPSSITSGTQYTMCMQDILVKVPCECITGNIARGRGREPIKHEVQPSALFARDHARVLYFP